MATSFRTIDGKVAFNVFKSEPDSSRMNLSMMAGLGENYRGLAVSLTKHECYDLGLLLMKFASQTPEAFDKGEDDA